MFISIFHQIYIYIYIYIKGKNSENVFLYEICQVSVVNTRLQSSVIDV